MVGVVGIHGMAQQQLGRRQLLGVWEQALLDGVELASGTRVAKVDMDLAYYGELFLSVTTPGIKGGSDDEFDLPPATAAFVIRAAEGALTAEDITTEDTEEKGYTRTPRPLQKLLRAMDRRFGARAGALFVRAIGQVHRYLTDPTVRDAVHEIVEATVTPDTRLLVGHSLGSVVALEHLRRHPHRELDVLLTIGSPLGLRTIQNLLESPLYGAAEPGLPAQIGSWINVRDARDPVACAGDLTRFWPGLTDVVVDNGGDAHSALRYLGKRATGENLVRQLPDLFASAESPGSAP